MTESGLSDSDQDIVRILSNSHVIAVVGLSPKPARPSYIVSQAMQSYGYRIIPVRPAVDTILGEKVYVSLLDVNQPIDIVNVFRCSEHVSSIVEQTIKVGAKCLWLQEGIQTDEIGRLREAGVEVCMDRCILKDYRRLLGK